MEFKTPEDENKYLRAVLVGGWELFCDCYLAGSSPDEIRRSTSFRKFDAKLRELNVLPKTD